MLGKLQDGWERRQKKEVEYASNISDNRSERVEKKECPTFLHKIVDRSPNLASCFDTEGKRDPVSLGDMWREDLGSEPLVHCPLLSVTGLPSASAVLYSVRVAAWVRLHRYFAGP